MSDVSVSGLDVILDIDIPAVGSSHGISWSGAASR